MRKIFTTFILAASLGYVTCANAYFVRAFNVDNGNFTDSLINNGATSAQISVGNSLMSQVNLDDGTVKALVDVSGTNMVVQAGGVFGDTVSFNDAAMGTDVDFSFDYDGEITITNVGNQGSNLQYGIFANFYIFEAGSGVDALNFSTLGTELFKKVEFLSFEDPIADVSELIAESLFGSLTIGAVKDFDVVASLSVFTATNDNDVSVKLDFANTGTFGINTAPNVTYSSASGVFLNSVMNPTTVSEPGALALLFLGLSGLFVSRKRKLS